MCNHINLQAWDNMIELFEGYLSRPHDDAIGFIPALEMDAKAAGFVSPISDKEADRLSCARQIEMLQPLLQETYGRWKLMPLWRYTGFSHTNFKGQKASTV
jgi:hypothetical protein